MNKRIKSFIVVLLIAIVILIFLAIMRSARSGILAMKYCNTYFMLDSSNKFLWLFDSSKMTSVECKYAIGNREIEKYRFIYTCENRYRYVIFTDSAINNIGLKDVEYSMIYNTSEISSPYENNTMGWGGDFGYQSRMCIDSLNKLVLSTTPTGVVKKISSSSCLQFNGVFQNASIKNENGKVQYLIKFNKPTLTTMVFYKPKNILYIIVINSFENSKQDNNGINYLDLKE